MIQQRTINRSRPITNLLLFLLAAGLLLRLPPDRVAAMPTRHVSPAAVAVTTSPTTLFEETLDGESAEINLAVTSAAGGGSLTDFEIWYKTGSTWTKRFDTGDYALGVLTYCSTTTPDTLTAGGTADLTIPAYAADAIRCVATSASSSTITVEYTVKTVVGHLANQSG